MTEKSTPGEYCRTGCSAPELAAALKDAAELAEECATDTAGTPSALMFAAKAATYRAKIQKAGVA